jgi:hypothetical protein
MFVRYGGMCVHVGTVQLHVQTEHLQGCTVQTSRTPEVARLKMQNWDETRRERERVRVRACVCVCTYCDTGSIAPGCIVSPHSSFNFCVPCPHIYHFPINIHFLRTPNENDELRFHFMYNKEKRTKVHADGEVYLHPENIHRS